MKISNGVRKFFILFIFVLLLYLSIFLLHGENIFFVFSEPWQKFLYRQKQDPIDQYDICEDLKIENMKLKSYRAENQILKQHLNFLTESQDEFILANILGRRYESGFNWIIINKGEKDGISPGLAVVDQKGSLVGSIIASEDSISYVRPLLDLHSFIAADIINFNEDDKSEITSGIIQGEYNLIVKMKYVPLGKKVKLGDIVITSGMEEGIRRGIIIGQVTQINKKPNDIFQELVITPLAEQNLRIVSVLLPVN
ncbi:rod shape-determining protein MreC [Candidatus Parcubacteria bacterium 4484_255]|nr:MAG: rod shape-determining protein MreC [Candidatus Parcubacteria bacterium 4484_255]